MVSGHRELDIDWQPFSLAMKNAELSGKDDKTKHAGIHRPSHRILRVMLAASDQGAKLIDLYTDFGIAYHIADMKFDDELIADVLSRRKLPAELIKAADDTGYDERLKLFIRSATDVAGEDIGVPTIIFTNGDGTKNGFFGPVLQQLPDLDESLKLWDGLSLLASDKNFYELKRARPHGGPDVFSTAKC